MFTPSRAAGRKRLESFLPRAGADYRRRRNFDLGPGHRDNVSCLSPYLRRRLLLESEVLAEVVARHGPEAAAKFIEEVFWRSYFRGWMAHHPGTWANYREAVCRARERTARDACLQERLDAAWAGETGIGAFDTWVDELVDHGYLHNHARMWFASIWIFTLELPWALGADFFMRHLLDGDPASNTLGWRWVAGLHTRGKTYLARRDNILRYTEGRLDPGPDLAREATPLEEERNEAPRRSGLAFPEVVPEPGTSEPSGWLITDEDCRADPELAGDRPVLGLTGSAGLSPDPVADPVHGFAFGAVRDALARLDRPGAIILTPEAGQSPAAGVLEWCHREGLREVHLFHVPYGPLAGVLDDLEPVLAAQGVAMHRHVRALDRAAWPRADRGFFRLKRHIPNLLDALGVGA